MTSSNSDSLNQNSHLPYYVQIKYYLRQIIRDLGPNMLVPSEKELAENSRSKSAKLRIFEHI